MIDRQHQAEIQALRRTVVAARDGDDLAAFEDALAALAARRGSSPEAAFSSLPSSFRLMYDGEQKMLSCYQKHGQRHFGVQAPDEFAAAALQVLQSYREEGFYGPYPLPQGLPPTALLSYLEWLQATGQVPEMEGATAREAFKTWRACPALALVDNQADALTLSRVIAHELAVERPVRVAVVGLLLALILKREPEVAAELRAPLMARSEPTLRLLAAELPSTDYEAVSAILEQAGSALRRAGRQAYEFLAARSGHQYERVEVVELETPVFRPRPAA